MIALIVLFVVFVLMVLWIAFAMSNHDSAYEEMKKRIEEDE